MSYQGTRQIAKRALRTANYVKDQVDPSTKSYQVQATSITVSGAGTCLNLIGAGSFAGIAQGTQSDDRVADRIKLQRLVLRGIIAKSNLGPSVTAVRVILFKGKAEEGVLYTRPELLQFATVFSSKSEANRYSTNFIYDELFVVDDVKSQYVEFDWNIPLNWYTTFDNGSTNVWDGGLYMFVMSNAGSNFPILDCVFRVSYTDA